MARKKKNKRKVSIVVILIMIAAVVLIFFRYFRNSTNENTSFTLEELQVTDIESIVSSTGTLTAVGTVEVGTQVSGKIDSVLVDYNDEVKEGEILAILDRTTLKSTFRDAQSSLKKAKAQYDLAFTKYENDRELHNQELISRYEYQSTETELVVAEANLTSAEINLEKADQNLNEYAIIKAPMNGIVMSREIEEGQTVQASMSAPTLFILAKDLHNMEIEALVDESDIGSIRQGQEIRFTVEAFPDQEFKGDVKQVRMEPSVVSDVVHYTVICSAENDEEILLPGMTATIEFIIESRKQVQAVSNSAFTVSIPESVIEKLHSKRQQPVGSIEEKDMEISAKRKGKRELPENAGVIWYQTESGETGMAFVEKGLSDDINTEILNIKNLPENAGIIVKVKSSGNTESSSNSGQRRMGPPGGPGLF